jgi:CTP:molybdopterin cytidylyltransferase MocA
MGQPKLLMNVGGQTVIERTLASFSGLSLAGAAVIGRLADHPLRQIVQQVGPPFDWVTGQEDPADMLASIRLGVDHLRERFHPTARDWFFLLPADYPVIDREVALALVATVQSTGPVAIVPTFTGERGHPVLMSWSVTDHLNEIPEGHGFNWLTREGIVAVTEVPLHAPGILQDLDTPADFDAISQPTVRLSDGEACP